jgi:hypothetical protein
MRHDSRSRIIAIPIGERATGTMTASGMGTLLDEVLDKQ